MSKKLRAQYSKETGKNSKVRQLAGIGFTNDYVEWLESKAENLPISDVGNNEETVCPNCDGEGFSGKGTTEVLPCLSCFGSGVRAD